MKLITTDEFRRRQMRAWWQGISSRGEDPAASVPALPNPPTPALLFGARDDELDAHVGCNDFDDNHAGIARVNVYRSFVPGGPYSLVGNFVLPDNNVLFDSDVPGDGNAYYVLRSLGDGIIYKARESSDSMQVCAMLFPENVQAFPDTFSADISWEHIAPHPAQDWQIQYGTDPLFGAYVEYIKTNVATLVQGLPVPGKPFLMSDTTYYFRIRARDSDECVSPWSTISFDTLGE